MGSLTLSWYSFEQKGNQDYVQYKTSVTAYQQIKFGHKEKQHKPKKFVFCWLYIVSSWLRRWQGMHQNGKNCVPIDIYGTKQKFLQPVLLMFHLLLHPLHFQARLGMASLLLERILELTVKFDIVGITFNSWVFRHLFSLLAPQLIKPPSRTKCEAGE